MRIIAAIWDFKILAFGIKKMKCWNVALTMVISKIVTVFEKKNTNVSDSKFDMSVYQTFCISLCTTCLSQQQESFYPSPVIGKPKKLQIWAGDSILEAITILYNFFSCFVVIIYGFCIAIPYV